MVRYLRKTKPAAVGRFMSCCRSRRRVAKPPRNRRSEKSEVADWPPTLAPNLRCQSVVGFSIGAKQSPTDGFLHERQCLPCLTGVSFGSLSTKLGCRQPILLGV